MAELVDALASGASVRKYVEVQVLSSAPIREPYFTVGFLFFSDIIALGGRISHLYTVCMYVCLPYIAMYEARSSTSIPVAAWSHLEQPVQHIKAIQSLLAKHRVDIPIYAIEGTEKYWAQKPFSVLVGSKSK